MKDVNQVLERLGGSGIILKPTKCCFAMKEVEFLGHLVCGDGTKMQKGKIDALQDILSPTEPLVAADLKRLVQVAQYYARLINGFAHMAHAIHTSLAAHARNGASLESLKVRASVAAIKAALQSDQVLMRPDMTQPFRLEVDTAVSSGVGAVLSQLDDEGQRRPIAFYSRAFAHGGEERRWSVTQAECSGVVEAVEHFRQYLLPNPHTTELITDHASLQYLLTAKQLSDVLTRYAMRLSEFDVKLTHHPGKTLIVPDALSRLVKPAGPSPPPPLRGKPRGTVWETLRSPRQSEVACLVLLDAAGERLVVLRGDGTHHGIHALPSTVIRPKESLTSATSRIYDELRLLANIKVDLRAPLDQIYVGKLVFIFKRIAPAEWLPNDSPIIGKPRLLTIVECLELHRPLFADESLATLLRAWQCAYDNGERPLPYRPAEPKAEASKEPLQGSALAALASNAKSYKALPVRREVALVVMTGDQVVLDSHVRPRKGEQEPGKAYMFPREPYSLSLTEDIHLCQGAPKAEGGERTSLDRALHRLWQRVLGPVSLPESSARNAQDPQGDRISWSWGCGVTQYVIIRLPQTWLSPHTTTFTHELLPLSTAARMYFTPQRQFDRLIVDMLVSSPQEMTSHTLDARLNCRTPTGSRPLEFGDEDPRVTQAAAGGKRSDMILIRTATTARDALWAIHDFFKTAESDARVMALDIEGALRVGGWIGLIQIHVHDVTYVFDTIYAAAIQALVSSPPAWEVPPLAVHFDDESITKVVHSGVGDAMALYSIYGCCLRNVFDTCIADSLLRGARSSRGLGIVIEEWTGITMPEKKTFNHTDTIWRERPLPWAALQYAAADVAHCVILYHIMLRAARTCKIDFCLKYQSLRLPDSTNTPVFVLPMQGDLLLVRKEAGSLHLLRTEARDTQPRLPAPAVVQEAAQELWQTVVGGNPSLVHDVIKCKYLGKSQRVGPMQVIRPQVLNLHDHLDAGGDTLPEGLHVIDTAMFREIDLAYETLGFTTYEYACIQWCMYLESKDSGTLPTLPPSVSQISQQGEGATERLHLLHGAIGKLAALLPRADEATFAAVIVHDDINMLVMQTYALERQQGVGRPSTPGLALPKARIHSGFKGSIIARQALEVLLGPLERLSAGASDGLERLAYRGRFGDTLYYEANVYNLTENAVALFAAWQQRAAAPTDAATWIGFRLIELAEVSARLDRSDDTAAAKLVTTVAPSGPDTRIGSTSDSRGKPTPLTADARVAIDTGGSSGVLAAPLDRWAAANAPERADAQVLSSAKIASSATSGMADSHARTHAESASDARRDSTPSTADARDTIGTAGSPGVLAAPLDRLAAANAPEPADAQVLSGTNFVPVTGAATTHMHAGITKGETWPTCCHAHFKGLFTDSINNPLDFMQSCSVAADAEGPLNSPMVLQHLAAMAVFNGLPEQLRETSVHAQGGAASISQQGRLLEEEAFERAAMLQGEADAARQLKLLHEELHVAADKLKDDIDKRGALQGNTEAPQENTAEEKTLHAAADAAADAARKAKLEPPLKAPPDDPSLGNDDTTNVARTRVPGWAPEVSRAILLTEQQADPYIKILATLASPTGFVERKSEGTFELVDDLLFRIEKHGPEAKATRRQVVVPATLRGAFLRAFHDRSGHPGVKRVMAILRERAWWVGLRRDVRNYIRRCPTCALTKLTRIQAGQARSLGDGHHPGDVWTTDILDIDSHLRKKYKEECKASGKEYDPDVIDNIYHPHKLLIFIDRFSRWVEAFLLDKDPTADEVLDIFVNEIVRRHGFPRAVTSDRGSNLIQGSVAEYYEACGIQLVASDSYMHNTAGLVERFNGTLKDILRGFLVDVDEDADVIGLRWWRYLTYGLLSYNMSDATATGYSPFFLMYGRDARLPLQNTLLPLAESVASYSDYVQKHLEQLSAAWKDAREKVAAAASTGRQQQNLSRDISFELKPGDRVLIKKPNHQGLEVPYAGPFRVAEVLGDDRVQLRDLHRIMHDEFHISRLKLYPYVDNDGNVAADREEYIIKDIKEHRKTGDSYEYLVKWDGWNMSYNSWVAEAEFNEHALELVAAYWQRVQVSSGPASAGRDGGVTKSTTETMPISTAPALRSHREQHLEAAPASFKADEQAAPEAASSRVQEAKAKKKWKKSKKQSAVQQSAGVSPDASAAAPQAASATATSQDAQASTATSSSPSSSPSTTTPPPPPKKQGKQVKATAASSKPTRTGAASQPPACSGVSTTAETQAATSTQVAPATTPATSATPAASTPSSSASPQAEATPAAAPTKNSKVKPTAASSKPTRTLPTPDYTAK